MDHGDGSVLPKHSGETPSCGEVRPASRSDSISLVLFTSLSGGSRESLNPAEAFGANTQTDVPLVAF